MVIQVPPTIWRTKMKNRYISTDYAKNIDEGIFDFQKYGNAVYICKQTWEEGRGTDLITLNDEEHNEELHTNIKLNSGVIPQIKEHLISIVKKYWDFFCKESTKLTILGYELSTDKGNAKPVCFKNPKYSP